MCFRPTLGERTHMHAHTHANIYGVGVEVNVTSCSPASELLQLCLNPAVTWPPPQLNSLWPAVPSAATTPISLHSYRTHTHASSSLQCQHQQHHSSRDSESGALRGPPPPPTFSPWCWSGQASLVWLAATATRHPPPPSTGQAVTAVMSLVYPCLLSHSVTTRCPPQHLAQALPPVTAFFFFLPSFWIHVNFLTFLAK